MHADCFNDLTRDSEPRSRRRFFGMITGFGGLLALTAADVAARCKKRCGPCKHCKNGKCKPKPEGTACAGGACQGGACLPTAGQPPPTPGAQPDAFCPGPGNVSVGTGNRLAQTFTANTRGWLVSVQLVLNGDASSVGDYILQVATTDGSGVPTNTVLATTTVAANQVPDGLSTVTFTFPDPATVLPGRRYALVLRRQEGPDDVWWRAHDFDACATGASFNSAKIGDFYLSDPQYDYLFATFVTP
jgi:hypothetical protein